MAEVPRTPGAALLEDRLRERREALWDESPDAIAWAAVVLHALHQAVYGAAAALAGDRTPRYRRAQLGGEKSLPIEDLVYMALEAPHLMEEALDALLLMVGCVSVPIPRPASSVCETNSRVLRAFGEFEAVLSEAQEDGVLDATELLELRSRFAALQDGLTSLLAAIGAEAGEGR